MIRYLLKYEINNLTKANLFEYSICILVQLHELCISFQVQFKGGLPLNHCTVYALLIWDTSSSKNMVQFSFLTTVFCALLPQHLWKVFPPSDQICFFCFSVVASVSWNILPEDDLSFQKETQGGLISEGFFVVDFYRLFWDGVA